LGQSPDVVEVDNNYRAIEFGLKAIEQRPLSVGLIKEMHQILLRGTAGEVSRPGEFRHVQAHIGSSRDIRAARFVPAPPHAIRDCMDALDRFMTDDIAVPRVAKLALVHYQFEAIHPFEDGNGRIGRVLILLLMSKLGMLPLPLFNPSAYLEQNRRAYYDHLLDVSQRGEWAEWIEFLSRGIVDECDRTIRRITALQSLRLDFQERLNKSRASVVLTTLVDELFARPRVRLDDVMKLLGVRSSSAQRYIAKLVELEVLKEVTGQARNRVYLAHEIVDLFSKAL
jgi:Fic family protein